MSGFYDRMGSLSDRLLSRFGGAAILHDKDRTYDPLTGVATIANDPAPVLVVMTTEGGVTTATTTVATKAGDTITVNGTTRVVVSVEAVAPIGEAIVYRATLG